jgi:hypothetical protein
MGELGLGRICMILSCYLQNIIGVIKSRRIKRARHLARRGRREIQGFEGKQGKELSGKLKHGYEE